MIPPVGELVVVGSAPWGRLPPHRDPDAMNFRETARRGLPVVTVVNETYDRDGHTVTSTLRTQIDRTEGQRIRVTIDATNIAVSTFQEAITADVDVTHRILEDDVPAGRSVEEGSYSVPPDQIVDRTVRDDDGGVGIATLVLAEL